MSSLNVLKDGSEVECCTLGNETGFGLLAAMEPAVSFTRDIIQVPGEGWVMPVRLFRAACLDSAALQAAVRRHLRAQMGFMAQSVACNARHKLEARFARWLLTCGAYVDSDVIPLTQEFLAAMLGVQRTTLTEAAAGLQELGLIRVLRGRVQILDHAGLTLRSCECYDATRDRVSALIGAPTPH